MAIEWTESIVGLVLFFFGANFFVLGSSLISKKPDLKSAGVFCTIAAVFNAIAGLFAATTLGLSTTGTYVLIFSLIWIGVGIILIQGYGLAPVGDFSIYAAIAMAWYFYAFTRLAVDYVLAWSSALFFIAFVCITAASRGKLSLKALGWVLTVEAFAALLIPAWLYFMGIAPIA
jgi:hypothetical protein